MSNDSGWSPLDESTEAVPRPLPSAPSAQLPQAPVPRVPRRPVLSNRVALGTVVAIVVLLGIVVGVVWNTDWGHAHHHGGEPGAGAPDGWTFDGPDDLGVRLVSDGPRVCSVDGDELFCLDSVSGTKNFDLLLPSDGTAPVLVGDVLVTVADGGAERGDVAGYSVDGELLWEASSITDVDVEGLRELGSVLPAAGNVVAVPLGQYGENGIVGLDAQSGETLWRLGAIGEETPFTVIGELISDGHRFYADGYVSGVSETLAIEPSTGELLWHEELAEAPDNTFLRAAAAINDGTLVALGLYGSGSEAVVVDAATGAERWRVSLETDWGGLAHLDGITVVADSTGLRAYGVEGDQRWSTEMAGWALTPDLVVTGSDIYVVGDEDLIRVDPTTGDTQVVLADFWATTVVATDSHLVAAGAGWEALPL